MRWLGLSVLLSITVTSHAQEAANEKLAAAEALIRYEASSIREKSSRICISLDGDDIPSELVKRLKDTGLQIVSSGIATCDARMPIGAPKLASDGDFEVAFGLYFCMDGCGASMFAFMRHDKDGWRVLRTKPAVYF